MSIAISQASVIGGVDCHKDSHHAAVIDDAGRFLGSRQFPANHAGYGQMLTWLQGHGPLVAVGVEGTGSYGAGLARFLTQGQVRVIEINRANPRARRQQGKSDPLDAEQAARAVLATTATATPKSKTGPIEVIRVMRITRSTAVKARTQAMNAMHAIVITAPDELRDDLVRLTGRALVQRCAKLRPETANVLDLVHACDRLVLAGTKTALRGLAQRWIALDEEIKALNVQLRLLVQHAAPDLVALPGVGAEVAGQLLITAGDNSGRLHSEAAFARLCGVAPQPASSGRTTGRHRLSRGGDRAANSALYMVAITRLRRHQPTRDYVARRTAEGLSKREILRCVKRYIAREVYATLPEAHSRSLPPRLDAT